MCILRWTFKHPARVEALQTGGDHEPGALVMEIPLDLERRLEQRWVARFFRTKRIALKGCINRMAPPALPDSETRAIKQPRLSRAARLATSPRTVL
jgi:hypothetical protein